MDVISYTEARQHLAATMDKVVSRAAAHYPPEGRACGDDEPGRIQQHERNHVFVGQPGQRGASAAIHSRYRGRKNHAR